MDVTDPTFGAVLKARAAGAERDQIAVRYGDDALSWRELDRRSDIRAVQLLELGVQVDDLVAIALPNGVAHHEWTLAAWKAGATPCVLPSRLPGAELQDIVSLAEPRILIRPTADPIADARSIAGDGPVVGPEGPIPADLAAANWKALASGGSTGRPKLIVDHGPPRYTAKINGLLTLVGIPEGGVVLNPGPLYHNGPFLFSNLALVAGARLIGMERFDAEQCLALIARHRVDWVFMVPAMMHRIWNLPRETREAYDLSSLKLVLHMAAACPAWLKQAWIDWLGPDRILEGYAGTEGPGTMITGAEWLLKPGSVGRVPTGTITVRDEQGQPCAPGEVGEIFLPAAAAERFHYVGGELRLDAEGRMSLGDLGYVDADGYLFLADRRTDLIIRGGANIYAAEVESALSEHPAIVSAVVIGLPSDDLGQRVHAIIETLSSQGLAVEAIDAFVRARLSGYKRPESYEFVQTPLRDEAGKVRRSALREERLRWLKDDVPFRVQVRPAAPAEPTPDAEPPDVP
ncbi:AMP-binding protein [soil metagenome]